MSNAIDNMTTEVTERVEDDLNAIFQHRISEAVGHSEWTGDVDPPTTHSFTEGLRGVVRQLIENGLTSRDMVVEAARLTEKTFNTEDRDARHIDHITAEQIGGGSRALAIYFNDGDDYIWITDLYDYAGEPGYYVGYYRDGDDEGTMFNADDDEALTAVLLKLTAPGRGDNVATCGGCGDPTFQTDDGCASCGFPVGDMMMGRGWVLDRD